MKHTARVAMVVVVVATAAGVLKSSGVSAASQQPAFVRLSGPTQSLPKGSVLSGSVPGDQVLSAEVVLRPRDPQALSAFVASVSDPGSNSYRDYLEPGQFGPRFGASGSTIAKTRSWLESAGMSHVVTAPDDLSVEFQATAQKIRSALGVSVDRYALPGGATRFAPSSEPLVPYAIQPAVQAVLGLSDLGVPQPLLVKGQENKEKSLHAEGAAHRVSPEAIIGPQACTAATDEAGATGGYTSNQLATAYSLPAVYANGRLGAGISVAVYELEPFESSDISAFQSCFATHTAVSVTSVDGGAGTGFGSGEAALDIEQIIGLAPDSSIHVYEGPPARSVTGGEVLDVYRRIADDDTAPVVSTSWGVCEAGLEPGFAAAESSVFEQMAAQGQSVYAAAGDDGSEDCYEGGNSDSNLQVDDPGSQPDVTSVGGTSVTSLDPPPAETVWNSCVGQAEQNCAALGDPEGAGGGGVSSDWSMPSWQSGPGVLSALSSGTPCGETTGFCRQVPDVSASADPEHGVIVFYAGSWQPVGGTSASAPLWAAVTAVADQGCLVTGKTIAQSHVVGFANPKLYELGAQVTPPFNDVTTGNDDFTDTNSGKFPATAHYDMATGWGTPIVSTLLPDLQPAGGCPAVTGLSPSNGPTSGGTVVTISGSDLAGVTGVHFGSTAATNVSYDSVTHQVSATAPASAIDSGTHVTVTTADGTSADISFDVFTYTGPSVRSVVPPAGSPDGGELVKVSGGGFTGATAVHFGATEAESFHVLSSSTLEALSPREPDGTVVDITVTTPSGTSPRFAPDRFTFTFDPVVSAVSPTSGTVRGGTSVTVTGANFSGTTRVSFGGMSARFRVVSSEEIVVTSPASPEGAITTHVTVTTRAGTSSESAGSDYRYVLPAPGYWLVASDGGVFGYGGAGFHGSMGGKTLNKPIVGIAPTADGGGYWMVASDGGIFAFGDAAFHGSMGGRHLNKPIVGIAPTADGGGYWMVASDGGIFAFGDAGFHGSMGGRHLNQPIVGMASTSDGGGYWMVASDGGIFAFGNAAFHGSMGGRHLNKPIVGIAPTLGGAGYWMVASDGGIFAFGNAAFHGSMGGKPLNAPIVGIAATADDSGYWLVGADGGIFAFSAPFCGSAGDIHLVASIVGAASH